MSDLIKLKGAYGKYEMRVLAAKQDATIVIDKASHDQMTRFVALVPTECMWYSCIRQLTTTASDLVAFGVTDILIPHQVAADKEVEASSEQMAALFQEVRTQRGLSAPELSELMKSATVWCHSHVEMEPKPSPQDDIQWGKLIEAADSKSNNIPIAMIIMNKKGEYTSRVYDPATRIEYTNVDIVISDNTDYSYVKDAVANKVKKPTPKTVVKSSGGIPNYSNPNHSPSVVKSDGGGGGTNEERFSSGDSTVTVVWGDKLKEEQKKMTPDLEELEMMSYGI